MSEEWTRVERRRSSRPWRTTTEDMDELTHWQVEKDIARNRGCLTHAKEYVKTCVDCSLWSCVICYPGTFNAGSHYCIYCRSYPGLLVKKSPYYKQNRIVDSKVKRMC
jgi:hypothetical protein